MVDTTASSPVLLDLDGTLVDSVFHHVLAWGGAFGARDYDVPLWRIHETIGMGGSRLIPQVLGRHVDDAEMLKADHEDRFLDLADDLRATDGALDLLDDLADRGVPHIVATSATGTVAERLLSALGRPDLRTVNADEVGSPKPSPDLLLTACEAEGWDPGTATMIGDSPWDAEAAVRIGMRMIAVRTGGFGDSRLLDGGAFDVVDSPRRLVGRL